MAGQSIVGQQQPDYSQSRGFTSLPGTRPPLISTQPTSFYPSMGAPAAQQPIAMGLQQLGVRPPVIMTQGYYGGMPTTPLQPNFGISPMPTPIPLQHPGMVMSSSANMQGQPYCYVCAFFFLFLPFFYCLVFIHSLLSVIIIKHLKYN